MNDQHTDGGVFRFLIGFVALATAVGGFAALFVLRVPAENKDAMMFALGSVFGWATSVIASEYGSTATGRKVAESAVRQMERQTVANEGGQAPPDAQAAAQDTADAAQIKADEIGGGRP